MEKMIVTQQGDMGFPQGKFYDTIWLGESIVILERTHEYFEQEAEDGTEQYEQKIGTWEEVFKILVNQEEVYTELSKINDKIRKDGTTSIAHPIIILENKNMISDDIL